MSTENLKVVITGDASDLDKAGAEAQKALDGISKSADEWDKRARELNIQMNYTNRSISSIGNSAKEAASKITNVTTEFTGVRGGAIRAQYALSGIERAFRGDGIQGYVFGLQQTAREFGDMVTSSGSVKAALSSVGAVLMGPAGIIFGISFLAEVISKFVGKAKEVPEAVKQAKQQIDQLRKSVLDSADAYTKAQDNTAKQEASLKLLYTAATDVTRSMNERLNAAKKLQDIWPDQFKAFSQEQIIVGQAATAYKNLADNILKAAQAEANLQTIIANDQTIHKAQNDLAKTQAEYDKLTDNVKKAKKDLDDYNKSNSGAGSVLAGGAQGAGGAGLSILLSNYNKAQQALKALTDQQKQYRDIINSANSENDKLAQQTQTLNLTLKQLGDTTKNTGNKIKSTADIMAGLEANFKTISILAKGLGLSEEQIGAAQIKALYETIEAIAKQGGPQAVDVIKKLAEQARQIQASSFLPTLSGGRAQVNAPSGIGNNPGVPTYINPEVPKDVTNGIKTGSIYTKEWASEARLLDSAFESVFSSIANGQNFFQSLIQVIEQLIIKLTAAAAAAAILSVFTGGGSAGFSALFGQISGLKGLIPSHAQGGYIPGPQLAIVGDAPGGEWVLNQRQISAILNGSGGGRNINVTGRIEAEGSTLQVILDNANKKTNRRN